MTLLSLRDPLRGVANPKIGASVHVSHSYLYCGVDVPDETGKMSRSDKRGATLPKVATVVTLLRNDVLVYCHYK